MPVYAVAESEVAGFLSSLPLMRSLKSDALRPRHWRALMAATGREFDMDARTFTLGSMFAMQLHKVRGEGQPMKRRRVTDRVGHAQHGLLVLCGTTGEASTAVLTPPLPCPSRPPCPPPLPGHSMSRTLARSPLPPPRSSSSRRSCASSLTCGRSSASRCTDTPTCGTGGRE